MTISRNVDGRRGVVVEIGRDGHSGRGMRL